MQKLSLILVTAEWVMIKRRVLVRKFGIAGHPGGAILLAQLGQMLSAPLIPTLRTSF
ncbi:hypothetical protein FA95DRAFT_1601819 [Auriscalpium vulgare]|uniref:Uncharacterized protein n=1 Tax=Auriscalpium vulgare TaxID=40419 RepID=A0ACB8S770_9AGAM|nr:hypothetical protein FA95DRAFT_1601819 [Auriscalpium vulgare]